jgi:peroxiredoxin Q/BCP
VAKKVAQAKSRKPAKKLPLKKSPASAVKAGAAKKSKVPGKSPKATSMAKKKDAVDATSSGATLLHAGEMAPPFSVQNEKGEVVSLKALRGKKVILYFYPKDATPGCTQEGCDFRDNFARLKKLGAEVYGVSRDSAKSHAKFQEKQSFPFSLLADEDGKVCEAYGVWKEKSLYGRKYMGIERSTFVIDENGRLLKVYPKVKVAGHVDQVLEDLK